MANPPPSYGFFVEAQRLKIQTGCGFSYIVGLTKLFMQTVGCTIFLAFLLCIPATMMTIGIYYLGFCPAEPYIPIFLVVGGSFWALQSLVTIGRRCFLDEDSKRRAMKYIGVTVFFFGLALGVFQFAWFIAGNVWVYRLHGDWSSDPAADNYCDPTLYWFSFWLITAGYILAGSVCCCFLCFGGIYEICACCIMRGFEDMD